MQQRTESINIFTKGKSNIANLWWRPC